MKQSTLSKLQEEEEDEEEEEAEYIKEKEKFDEKNERETQGIKLFIERGGVEEFGNEEGGGLKGNDGNGL